MIHITDAGNAFVKAPTFFMMTEDHKYETTPSFGIVSNKAQGVVDAQLMKMLLGLRKKVAQNAKVPPYAVFQEYSLEDMCLKYPISEEEMVVINGVGEGKARRYGKEFVRMIKTYVEENDIIRPDDLIVKSTGVNSTLKLYLIQSVDRKLSLDDIASAKGMKMDELITEMETIVFSGTKLNISYWLEELLDEEQIEELYDYFIDAESDSIDAALEEFDGDYEEEELRLYRIQFFSEIAN